MKISFFILGILLTFTQAKATSYYLSSSSGDDLINDGKSIKTAWQSINKLKTVLNLLLPGDSVFFKCNDTFNGQLILSRSGNTLKNIYFGSYGTGKKPVLSGTVTVTNWVQTSTNIWEATCASAGSKVTNFFINGIPQQIGRWPNITDSNKGYLSYESHKGTNQITDNQLTNAIDWTGAEAVTRRVRWILDRLTIKSHTANTLLFTTNVDYEFSDGFGYFIQNDPKTLDQQGEWYFNPVSKKFSIYSEVDPNTLITKATQLDNLIKISGRNYIILENLQLMGSGQLTLDIDNCNKITIRNNEFIYSGENAVDFNASNNILFESNLINHTNNNAFIQNGCKNFVMRNNVIKNTAMVAGMGLGGDGQYNAVQLGGSNLLVEYNNIDSVGYIGMNFNGDTLIIKNNVISNYCMTKDDGGGLYTWSNGTKNYSRKLIGNILLNAVGAAEGAVGNVAAEGIYIDDRSSNVDIIGNTVYKCGNNGIYIHNANHINIRKNTAYDNGKQLWFNHDNIAPTFPITNCAVDSNIFVSRQANQMVASFETVDNGISAIGTFDHNFYCSPFGANLIIKTAYVNETSINEALILESWMTKYKKDLHSGISPILIADYKILSVKTANYFTNSAFESSTSSWSTWSNYNNSKLALAKAEGVTGNALKASFTALSGKADGYMLVSSNSIKQTVGKTYRLKFSAKSSIDHVTLKLIPRKNGDPYNNVAADRIFMLTTTYNEYEFLIEPTITETNTRYDFQIQEGQGNIWFDNLELVEVDVEKTNPDDFIKFEYNASKNDKSISVSNNQVDVKGISVSENVVLKPFTSIILFKKLSTSIGFQPETIDSDIRLIPNPAANYVRIKSNAAIISVWLHDMNGQIIQTHKGSGTKEYTIGNLPIAGAYILEIKTKNKTEFKKLFIRN